MIKVLTGADQPKPQKLNNKYKHVIIFVNRKWVIIVIQQVCLILFLFPAPQDLNRACLRQLSLTSILLLESSLLFQDTLYTKVQITLCYKHSQKSPVPDLFTAFNLIDILSVYCIGLCFLLCCLCVCVQLLIRVQLLVIPWTGACQSPVSMEFSRQEYWSGLQFPTPGDPLNLGIEATPLTSPALIGRFFTTMPPGKPPTDNWSLLLYQMGANRLLCHSWQYLHFKLGYYEYF